MRRTLSFFVPVRRRDDAVTPKYAARGCHGLRSWGRSRSFQGRDQRRANQDHRRRPNLSQETVSADDGSYRFLALPVGTYTLTALIAGFERYDTTGIVLQVNDQLRIDIALKVGAVNEQVSVAADMAHVETATTQLGDVIESKKMLALPLNGRSYIDLLGLQAGVVPVTAGSIQQDRPVSGYLLNTGNVSVNGQRETANAFLVNGGDVSEGRNLGAGLVPNLDSVEEFRLITNSFDAEYGKFSGAVMNAITKSGTNGIHGDAFEFLRNDTTGRPQFLRSQQVRVATQSVWLRHRGARSGRTSCSGLRTTRARARFGARKPASCKCHRLPASAAVGYLRP